MATKRTLVPYSEIQKGISCKSEKIREAYREYYWMSPKGFIRLKRLVRLTEIQAPAIILFHEFDQMVRQMGESNIARNEIFKIKQLLFKEYPLLEKEIVKGRKVRNSQY